MRMKRSFRAWVPSLVASTALIAPLGLPASPDVLANAIIPVEDAGPIQDGAGQSGQHRGQAAPGVAG